MSICINHRLDDAEENVRLTGFKIILEYFKLTSKMIFVDEIIKNLGLINTLHHNFNFTNKS